MDDLDTSDQRIIIGGVLLVEDEVLLVRRDDGHEAYTGFYEAPGGGVEPGEHLKSALVREFKLKTGLMVVVGEYLRDYSWSSRNDTKHTMEVLFEVSLEAGQNPKHIELSSDSHDTYKWVDWNSLDEMKMSEQMREAVKGVMPQPSSVVNIATKEKKLKIFTDGGSRGNPGPSASGFVILTTKDEILDEGGEYLGINTNNQAEYEAVVLALKAALRFGPVDLDFFIDSLLVVNQLNGSWQVKKPELRPVNQEVLELVKQFGTVTFTHVKREFNTMADSKVNEVLDSIKDVSESE